MKLVTCSKAIIGLTLLTVIFGPPVQSADADIIFESATMGATGQMGGWGIDTIWFMGSRFYINQQVQVTAIGGHMLEWTGGNLFGVIVSLDSASDLPDGFPFTAPEVVASTVLDPGTPSSDFRTPLSVTLTPGYYAVIFGSGQFGSTSGLGALPYEDQSNLPGASYILWDGSFWWNSASDRARFVVEGTTGPSYCSASGGCGYEYIGNVNVGTINNSSGCSGYADYTAITTEMDIETGYVITVTNGAPIYPTDKCGIWVDWNQDLDFDDPCETITVSGNPGVGPYTATITPPADANLGDTRLRICITDSDYDEPTPCGTISWGEFEDYTITVTAPAYCDASGGCGYEYIGNVNVGTINNSSGCSGYADYTAMTTEMDIETGYVITVTNGEPIYPTDKCGIWADWNQDLDFDDPAETITVSGNPGVGPYTATITPPADANLGDTRLRICITDSDYDEPTPCGTISWGEFEDYTITVVGGPSTITISGCVKAALGVRIKGVNMSASTGETTVTDALGYYELTLPAPFSGTITPSQTDWTFSPSSRTYSSVTTDQVNQDFTATYTVSYGGGSGTSLSPYLIYNAAQLNAIGAKAGDWGKYFRLMADIDLSGYDGKAGRPSFNRIGYYINFVGNFAFTGVFEGGGHTISNFTFDSDAGNDGVGIFGYVNASGAQVKNVELTDIDVNSTSNIGTGGLIGHMYEGTVTGCSVQGGSVLGDNDVGGLVGEAWNGTISDCNAEVNVSGNLWVGGLLGSAHTSGVVISDCHASCVVTSVVECGGLIGLMVGSTTRCSAAGNVSINYESTLDRTAGGLVGENSGTIEQCYSTANVVGNGADEIGGLVGRNLETILNSYAMGSVSGSYPTGGLVGLNWKTPSTAGSVTNCYSTGASNGAGLIGQNIDGVITGSFWDMQTSDQTSSDGGTGLTTTEMQTEATFLAAGWDFVGEVINGPNDIWRMCVDDVNYPLLSWQFNKADFDCPDGVDFIDLSVLASAWLTEQGQGQYNADCDISLPPDDAIDAKDLDVFSDNWLTGLQ